MKFKVIIVSLIISVLTCNFVYGQIRGIGSLKEFSHTSLYLGTYNSGLGWKAYTGGLVMSHYQPELLGIGLFVSLAYFSDPEEDLSATAQLSKAIWLTDALLVQFALGPLLSKNNDFGVSGTVLFGINNIIPLKSGVVFLQSDRYRNSEIGGVRWRYTLGVSLAI